MISTEELVRVLVNEGSREGGRREAVMGTICETKTSFEPGVKNWLTNLFIMKVVQKYT